MAERWSKVAAGHYRSACGRFEARCIRSGHWQLHMDGAPVGLERPTLTVCREAAARIAQAPERDPDLVAAGLEGEGWQIGEAARAGRDQRGWRYLLGDKVAWQRGRGVALLRFGPDRDERWRAFALARHEARCRARRPTPRHRDVSVTVTLTSA